MRNIEEISMVKDVKVLKEASLSISKFSQRALWQEALQVLAELPADIADVPVINAALTACGRASQRLKVYDLLQTIKKRSLQPSIITFGSVISALQYSDEWEPQWETKKPWQMGLDLFDEIRQVGLETNVFVCSSLLSKTADWRSSIALFHDMKQLSVSSNLVTFGALISACERRQEWLHALELKDILIRRNLENNLHTVCTALSACEKGWEISVSLLRTLRGPWSRLKPNAFACSAVVRACARSPKGWARALYLFFELEQSKVQANAVALGTAVAACEASGHWEIALQLLVTHEEILDIACLNCGISSCERGSRWQHALVLFAEAQLPNDSTYSAAMLACRKANQWQRALSLWTERRAVSPAPTSITWSAAVSAAESGSQWQLALSLLQECADSLLQLDGIIYSAASSACQKSHQWRWPLQLMKVMQCTNIELPLVVESVALEAADAGGWKATVHLLKKMQGRAQSDGAVMAVAMAACYQQQQHEQLRKLLDEAKSTLGWMQLVSHCHSCIILALHRKPRGLKEPVSAYTAKGQTFRKRVVPDPVVSSV